MNKKTKNLLVLISSCVAICLIIVFGIIGSWAYSYVSKSYLEQYKKYDSIKIGMNKEQVRAIMKTRPFEGSIDKFHYSKDFDEVSVFLITLPGVELSAAADVTVFYLKGKVIGKEASVSGTPIFEDEEVNATGSPGLPFILIMIVGIAGAIAWIVIFPKYEIIKQNSNRKFWIDILLGFSFITSLGIVVLLGLIVLGGFVEILSLGFEKIMLPGA